jgi:AcrR family transcriptional regulator
MTKEDEALRRKEILRSAQWCFLHFGFGKTSLEDIAKRARISRPLLYRQFKNKDEIFAEVLVDGFEKRFPIAEAALATHGTKAQRLARELEILLLEPWAEMAGAPMAAEFFEACTAVAPELEATQRKRVLKVVQSIIGKKELAEVFLLALDGLEVDLPSTATLRRRVHMLIECFVGERE